MNAAAKKEKGAAEKIREAVWGVIAHKLAMGAYVVLILIVGAFKVAGQEAMFNFISTAPVIKRQRERLDTVSAHCDTTAKRVDVLDKRTKKSEQLTREMFGSLMDADPKFRAAVKARAAKNSDAAEKKRETDALVDKLIGE